MNIDALAEYEKWLRYDTRLIFTNCGALTWYLRKAWLLDNAPELMPLSGPAEPYEIRKTIRTRLAKSEYFSHVRIRARMAFAERLLDIRRAVHQPDYGAGLCWSDETSPPPVNADQDMASDEIAFNRPGKPRSLKVADVGHQWLYLRWKWPRTAGTRLGYRVERSRQKSTGYETIAMTHACDLLLLPVKSGRSYSYRVRAFNPSGDGPPSDSVMVEAF